MGFVDLDLKSSLVLNTIGWHYGVVCKLVVNALNLSILSTEHLAVCRMIINISIFLFVSLLRFSNRQRSLIGLINRAFALTNQRKLSNFQQIRIKVSRGARDIIPRLALDSHFASSFDWFIVISPRSDWLELVFVLPQ